MAEKRQTTSKGVQKWGNPASISLRLFHIRFFEHGKGEGGPTGVIVLESCVFAAPAYAAHRVFAYNAAVFCPR